MSRIIGKEYELEIDIYLRINLTHKMCGVRVWSADDRVSLGTLIKVARDHIEKECRGGTIASEAEDTGQAREG